MTTLLEEKKKKIAESKKRIEYQEKMLREKERKLKTRVQIKKGSLVEKAGLFDLSDSALFGALLELKKLSENKRKISEWEKSGEEFKNSHVKNNTTPLIISFGEDASPEANIVLKKMKFKWNRFRQEWYGNAVKPEVEKALENYNVKIESLDLN